MAEIEHDLTRAVGALRSKRSPPPGAKARVLAGVEARLGGPGPGPSDGGGAAGAKAGVDGMFAAKVVGATVALTGGGLLILKLGVLAVRSLTGADAGAGEVAIVEVDEVPQTARVEAVEPEPRADEAVDAGPAAPEPAPVHASPKRSVLAAAPSEPAAAKSDISAELALIDGARQAASPDAAIAKLREHARRFPEGALRDEREAMWAIASCERKDFADAARRADALAARRPSSPLLDRVARACPSVEN